MDSSPPTYPYRSPLQYYSHTAHGADERDFEPFMKISGLMFVKSRTLLPTEKVSMEDELLEEDAASVKLEEPTKVRERLGEQF